MKLEDAVNILQTMKSKNSHGCNCDILNKKCELAIDTIINFCRKIQDRELIPTTKKNTLKAIEIAIIDEFNYNFTKLKIKKRTPRYVLARRLSCYFIRKYTNLTFVEIGLIFKIDHSTVIYYINKVNDFMKFDKNFMTLVSKLDATINEHI